MYADTELLHPYFQSFVQEGHPLDLCRSPTNYASLGNLIETSISEYDIGEGDFFNTPSPFMDEHVAGLCSMTTSTSLISCGDDAISSDALKIDIQSIDSEELLHEVFGETETGAVVKASDEVLAMDSNHAKDSKNLDNSTKQIMENSSIPEVSFPKSGSSECLSSMDWVNTVAMRPNFLDFREVDFGYGMRRAFSEGDIKTLGNGVTVERWHYNSEERKEKLSRYRCKKTKRNFDRKIKYACRKALADSQPRIKGRFAKAEDSDNLKTP